MEEQPNNKPATIKENNMPQQVATFTNKPAATPECDAGHYCITTTLQHNNNSSSSLFIYKGIRPSPKEKDSIEHVIVPAGIFVGYRDFRGCRSLKSIQFQGSFIVIIEEAFQRCTSLVSIIFPDNPCQVHIGPYTFEECHSLRSVPIPKNCTFAYIPTCAFRNCKSLTNMSLSDSIKQIANDAFDGCPFHTMAMFEKYIRMTRTKERNQEIHSFFTRHPDFIAFAAAAANSDEDDDNHREGSTNNAASDTSPSSPAKAAKSRAKASNRLGGLHWRKRMIQKFQMKS